MTAFPPPRAMRSGPSTPPAIPSSDIPASPSSTISPASPRLTTRPSCWTGALPQDRLPDVLTDLAILPAHLLDTVPRDRLRRPSWNERPVGNGPFRFVRHEPNRRWVFERNPVFPASLGGPPHIDRLVIAVVDEPMTKLAALVGGELDFAGIQPGHAPYVKKHADLAVVDYPSSSPMSLPSTPAARPSMTSPSAGASPAP